MAIGIFRRNQVRSKLTWSSFRQLGVSRTTSPIDVQQHVYVTAPRPPSSSADRSSRKRSVWLSSNLTEQHGCAPDPSSHDSERPPQTGVFSNNHVLINQERHRRGLHPLRRSRYLDELAQRHADYMAENENVMHSCASIEDLQALLGSAVVGENIQSGATVVDMHQEAVRCNQSNLCTMLGPDYREIGLAIAKSSTGKLYCCQYFRDNSRNGSSPSQGTSTSCL